MHLKQTLIVLLAMLLLSSSTLHAQVANNTALERFERQLDQIRRQTRQQANTDVPVDQRLLIDYGASLTLSYAAIDDSNFDTRQFNQYQLQTFARLNLDGAHNFFVRASSTYRDFHPGSDSFDAHGDDWEEFKLDRAVYRFDLGRFIASRGDQPPTTNLIVEGGRQYIHWFTGLVFSNELDAVQVTVDHDKLSLIGLAGTSTRRTIDIDSARPNYDTDTHRNYFAGALTYQLDEHHKPFIYGLVQRDHNNTGTYIDSSITGTTTAFDYESWYIGVGSQGSLSDQLLYNVEFVYQGGSGLSSAFDLPTSTTNNQTNEDISAWALAMNMAYQFKSDNFTRMDGEIILASGDSDRFTGSSAYGGNKTGTTDTAFNGFGSMDTGLAFAPDVTNLMMLRVGASTFPLINTETFKRLQVGTNVYLYGKLNKNGPINEVTDDHTFLGVETDFYANWRITNDLAMALRYGVFFGGDALTNNSHPRNLFFTSFTLAF
ncbi:MAG TPA: hypothetical protein DCM28_18565 [Phycisphaerales bacterium]|nr:hypothetical protein [Phycisphaerales bacterium]|tara:strand:+ start:32394 stop:33857 length:1464 start_codon:yes stop_codon:yes gene_type:complete